MPRADVLPPEVLAGLNVAIAPAGAAGPHLPGSGLLYGVTGFHRVGETPPPRLDARLVQAACWLAARAAGATVLHWQPAGAGQNFHLARLGAASVHVSMLVNAGYGLVGFVDNPSCLPYIFADQPMIADALRHAPPLRAIPASALNAVFTQADLVQLNRAELAQIANWKPERRGNIMFNHWD